MHFIHQFQCFEEFLHKLALIFQKIVFFQNFDRSNLFFDQLKLQLKNFGLVLCVLIDQTYFSINRKSYKEFFKSDFHVFKLTFQKVFKTFSFYTSWSRLQSNFFVVFLHSFCKGFLSQGQ